MTNILTFLLSPSVLWICTCISFLSADSIISVSARLNSTVLLPCNFTPDLSVTPHVRWRIGSKIVFERRLEKIYQGEGYEGRMDVPEDELVKGNCSLVLKNVRATDANIYNSYVAEKHEESYEHWEFVQNVKLRIDETPMSDKENLLSDKETHEEIPPRTYDAGIDSPNTVIIIFSVLLCVFIALLAIIVTILYRRRKSNQPSNEYLVVMDPQVPHDRIALQRQIAQEISDLCRC